MVKKLSDVVYSKTRELNVPPMSRGSSCCGDTTSPTLVGTLITQIQKESEFCFLICQSPLILGPEGHTLKQE